MLMMSMPWHSVILRARENSSVWRMIKAWLWLAWHCRACFGGHWRASHKCSPSYQQWCDGQNANNRFHWKIILWRRSRGDRRVIELPSFAAFASAPIGERRTYEQWIYLSLHGQCKTLNAVYNIFHRHENVSQNKNGNWKWSATRKRTQKKCPRAIPGSLSMCAAQRIPKRYKFYVFHLVQLISKRELIDEKKKCGQPPALSRYRLRMLIFNETHLFYIFRMPFAFFPFTHNESG